jgi:hypothetical protein
MGTELLDVSGYFDEAIPDPVTSNPNGLKTGDYEWEGKLRVVRESFDEDIPDPVTSVEEDNPGALELFADLWKAEKRVLELMEEEWYTLSRRCDRLCKSRHRWMNTTAVRVAVYMLDTKFSALRRTHPNSQDKEAHSSLVP